MKAAIVVLLCVLSVESTLTNFFSMLSDELKEQWGNVWTFIKEAIKRPARVKRVKHRHSTTGSPDQIISRTTLTTHPNREYNTAETETTTNEIATHNDKVPAFLSYFHKPKQLHLPIIAKPRWQTREDWMYMQQPHLEQILGREREFKKTRHERNQGMSTVDMVKLCSGRNCIRVARPEKPLGDVTPTGHKYRDAADSADDDVGVMMFI